MSYERDLSSERRLADRIHAPQLQLVDPGTGAVIRPLNCNALGFACIPTGFLGQDEKAATYEVRFGRGDPMTCVCRSLLVRGPQELVLLELDDADLMGFVERLAGPEWAAGLSSRVGILGLGFQDGTSVREVQLSVDAFEKLCEEYAWLSGCLHDAADRFERRLSERYEATPDPTPPPVLGSQSPTLITARRFASWEAVVMWVGFAGSVVTLWKWLRNTFAETPTASEARRRALEEPELLQSTLLRIPGVTLLREERRDGQLLRKVFEAHLGYLLSMQAVTTIRSVDLAQEREELGLLVLRDLRGRVLVDLELKRKR